MKKINFVLTIIFLLILYIYISYVLLIPNEIILVNSEKVNLRKLPGIELNETLAVSNNKYKNFNMQVLLFGKVNLKEVKVVNVQSINVIPVGKIIGLKLYTNGVLIVGMSEIEDKNRILNRPYELADIEEGDTLLKIDEVEVENIDSLKEIVNKSVGKSLELTLVRDGEIVNTSITPVETNDKEYKLGLWVKDAATGVGTMSFYEPNLNKFAVLGHGITDADTDKLINIDSGELVTSRIISIKKGEKNLPGEIKGTILNQLSIGNVEKNTEFGVFGKLKDLAALNLDFDKQYKIASRDEIKLGKAKILCALDENNVPIEYDINIEKIYKENNYNNKSILFKVTDEKLLEKTGGIIRGLSGAPIIQDNNFVGAVTNVLVSNPEIGYAVFADIMIKEIVD